MRDPIAIGNNKTGINTSPIEARRTRRGARQDDTFDPEVVRDPVELERERLVFSIDAEPVGTMPPPLTARGMAGAVGGALKGQSPNVLLDLLGARAAFERTGTRIYEALLVKHGAADPDHEGPTRLELERLRDDELRHYGMLHDAIKQLGGDPSAVTPSADIMAVATQGVPMIVADPRTTLSQALGAVMMVELADNEGWEQIIDLAEAMDDDDLVDMCREALEDEEEHLDLVRGWLKISVMDQAGVIDEDEEDEDDDDDDDDVPAPDTQVTGEFPDPGRDSD
jgi:rubrerythrin